MNKELSPYEQWMVKYSIRKPDASQLRVSLINGNWHSEELEPGRRARIVELFGTASIATPFTQEMPASEVLSRLRALNPGADISIDSPKLTEQQHNAFPKGRW